MNNTIIVSDSWTIKDLFEKSFWEENVPSISAGGYPIHVSMEQIFGAIPPPMPIPVQQPVDPIIEYWVMLPLDVQVKFKGRKDIFNYWLDAISESEFIIFSEMIENKRFDLFLELLVDNIKFQKIISDKEIIKDLLTEDQKIGKFDTLFVDFLKKVEVTDAILLNTTELIFIGGKSKKKVTATKENFIEKGFSIVRELSFMVQQNGRNKRILLVIMNINITDETA